MAETIIKTVRTPDGGTIKVSVPVGATKEQIMGFAKQEFDKRNAPPEATQPVGPDYNNMDALQLGLTSIGNVPGSAVQFAKDITAPIHSPVLTAKGLYSLGKGLIELAIPGEQPDEATARAVGQYFVDRYGMDGIRKTMATDPVGMLADVAGLLTGGASLLAKAGGKVGTIASTVGTIAKAADPTTLAMRGAGRVLKPTVNKGLKLLMDEGVKPTIGQVLGGPVGRMEEKLSSVPILGDVMGFGRTRSTEDLTRAAFNRALKPIGKSADGFPVDRTGLKAVRETLGKSYDELLDNVSFVIDDVFLEDVTKIIDDVAPGLEPGELSKLNNLVASKVLSRIADDGDVVTGKSLKLVQSDLLAKVKQFKSGSPGDREVADALFKVRTAVTDTLKRHNPEQRAALTAVDTGWANYSILRDAFTSAGGTKANGLTPARLDSAVRKADASTKKTAYSEGGALMQDLSEAGVDILGQTVPSSGTTERALATTLLAGGGGVAIDPTMGLLSILGSSAYIPKVQDVVGRMLTKRSPASQRLGAGIQKYGPTIGRAAFQSGRIGDVARTGQDPYLLRTGR